MNSSTRVAVYLIANALLITLMAVGAALHGGDHFVYLVLLFALCSVPILFLDHMNGRYVLMAAFTAVYFLLFGMLEVVQIVMGNGGTATASGGAPFLSIAEVAVLLGLACYLAGYLLTASAPTPATQQVTDWSQSAVLIAGLSMWIVGAAAIVDYQVFLAPEKTAESYAHAMAALGPMRLFFMMLAQMLAPLGMLILAYGYARYRTLLWLLVIVGMLAGQFAVAFLTAIRGQALTPLAIIVVALTLTRNRIPRTWLAVSILSAGVFMTILTVSRTVTAEGGLTRKAVAENLSRIIDRVVAFQEKAEQSGGHEQTQQSLLQRAFIKDSVELAIQHTGVDVPFENGRTLEAIPFAFIPRVIYPTKKDVAVGLVFNHEFVHGDYDTNISPSHLGELYWNFGWPGVIFGMGGIGLLMGFVGRKCDLSSHVSITRLLILLATVQYLCQGFEGGVSISYVQWLRSLGVIALLHLMLSRRGTAEQPAAQVLALPLPSGPRFQNVMP